MHKILFTIFICCSITVYGQCDRLILYRFHPGGAIEHLDKGTGLDSTGLYEGLYVYTDNRAGIFNDSTSYVLGRFRHGLPVGEWKTHCTDGSYGLGEFSGGGYEYTLGGLDGVVMRREGLDAKQGIWHYYNKIGVLTATYRYERQSLKKGTIDKTYRADSAGNFRLVWLHTIPVFSLWKMRICEQTYSDAGKLLNAHVESIWRDIYWEYYPNGHLKSKESLKRIHLFSIGKTVVRNYTSRGELRQIIKTRDMRISSPHSKFR